MNTFKNISLALLVLCSASSAFANGNGKLFVSETNPGFIGVDIAPHSDADNAPKLMFEKMSSAKESTYNMPSGALITIRKSSSISCAKTVESDQSHTAYSCSFRLYSDGSTQSAD